VIAGAAGNISYGPMCRPEPMLHFLWRTMRRFEKPMPISADALNATFRQMWSDPGHHGASNCVRMKLLLSYLREQGNNLPLKSLITEDVVLGMAETSSIVQGLPWLKSVLDPGDLKVLITDKVITGAAANQDDEGVCLLYDVGCPTHSQEYYLRIAQLARAVIFVDLAGVRILMESGAYPNARTSDSNTPLATAAFYGEFCTIRLLVKYDAVDIDFQGELGRMALAWAACRGHITTVQILLEHQADVSIKDKDGKTAEDLAVDGGNDMVAQILRDSKPSKVIADEPASILWEPPASGMKVKKLQKSKTFS